jgi:hypothetical protein
LVTFWNSRNSVNQLRSLPWEDRFLRPERSYSEDKPHVFQDLSFLEQLFLGPEQGGNPAARLDKVFMHTAV